MRHLINAFYTFNYFYTPKIPKYPPNQMPVSLKLFLLNFSSFFISNFSSNFSLKYFPLKFYPLNLELFYYLFMSHFKLTVLYL